MAYQRRIRDLVLDSDLENLKEELELNEDLVNIEIGRGTTKSRFCRYTKKSHDMTNCNDVIIILLFK